MHQIYIILAWEPSAVQVTKSYSRRLPALERFYKQRSPLYIYLSISVITVCLSVCLYVCLIITQEHLDRFASNFYLGTQETHGNFISLIEIPS